MPKTDGKKSRETHRALTIRLTAKSHKWLGHMSVERDVPMGELIEEFILRERNNKCAAEPK